MRDLRQWLAALGLERFAEAFEREEVTLASLPALSEADLKELGLPLGPRKQILKAVEALRGGAATTPPLPSAYTPPHLAERILTSRSAPPDPDRGWSTSMPVSRPACWRETRISSDRAQRNAAMRQASPRRAGRSLLLR